MRVKAWRELWIILFFRECLGKKNAIIPKLKRKSICDKAAEVTSTTADE